MDLVVRERELHFRAPLRTSYGELATRTLFEVELVGGGFGESAPLAPYDGVSDASVRAGLEMYVEVFKEFDDPEPALAVCDSLNLPPQAFAAVDLAVHKWGQSPFMHEPPTHKWGQSPNMRVPVNGLVGATDRASAAGQAAALVSAGHRCVKVKVGVGDDGGRLAAVRAAVGPDVQLRIDANGAWETPEEALANLRMLAPIGIELCEEPCHGVKALRAVREQSPGIPIASDETFAPASGATDYVCLKLSRCGGLTGLFDAAAAARTAGSEVFLASTFDGPLGIRAGLYAAAQLRVPIASGLATLGVFTEYDDLPVQDGCITLS